MKLDDTLVLSSLIDKTLLRKSPAENTANRLVLISNGDIVIITNGDFVGVGYETEFLRLSRIDKSLLVNSVIDKTLLYPSRIDKTLVRRDLISKGFVVENRIDKILLRESRIEQGE